MLTSFKYWVRPAIWIGVASSSCVLFTAFTPPALDPAAAARVPIVGTLPGDLPVYWLRFLLAFLLLGCLPAAVAWATGLSKEAVGLSVRTRALRSPVFWLAVPAAVVIGAIGAMSPDLAAYYPYSHDLMARVRASGLAPLVGHLVAYFCLYYAPWEFFFRGFLLLPLVSAAERAFGLDRTGGRESAVPADTAIVVAVCVLFQTIPSAMLHAGHPLSELLAAVPAGMAFGILAWRTRSIVPGLILHAAIGFGTDGFIVLRGAGYL